ncbi:alpha/beta hydrolase [Flavobacterium antarcticum]|uniref:alpha/beta hydrolase n=1 Tax=Flavobacterium antarcticum TaxID=271155 RepID=UPI0003B559F1|nr:alpha/beta hydrolase-fold protein [Flavobacterium antarcticum]
MKKQVLLFVLSLFVCPVFAQKTTDTIHSQKLKEDRIISISLPASYGKEKNKKYPLLLLLDGDYLFEPFNGALKFGNYWDDLPEVIVVGIDQSRPYSRDSESDVDQNGLPIEKGAQFFDFISMELLPTLEKKYDIAAFKIIAGHDVTAGFMNLFLYKDNSPFDAYISMSPELGTEMETRLPSRLSLIKKPLFYYQSTADGDLKKMQDLIKTLDTNIKSVKNSNLYYQFDDFKNASHYSLVLFSIPNALYHIFGAYQPISSTEFQTKIVTLPNDYVGYLTKKYDIIEKSYGIKMPIRINDFKAIEAAILKNNAFAEFEQLATLAKKSYPRAMLSQYHMGMFYEKTGDTKKAAKAYMNAYNMDEIGNLTKDFMLEKADQMK